MVIPEKAKFTALVGFKKDAAATARVKFSFSVVDESGTAQAFPGIDATHDGKLDLYEVDLSELAGQKRTFTIRVEAGDPAEQNWAVWVDPRLIQER